MLLKRIDVYFPEFARHGPPSAVEKLFVPDILLPVWGNPQEYVNRVNDLQLCKPDGERLGEPDEEKTEKVKREVIAKSPRIMGACIKEPGGAINGAIVFVKNDGNFSYKKWDDRKVQQCSPEDYVASRYVAAEYAGIPPRELRMHVKRGMIGFYRIADIRGRSIFVRGDPWFMELYLLSELNEIRQRTYSETS